MISQNPSLVKGGDEKNAVCGGVAPRFSRACGALPRTPPKTFLEKSFWISKNFDVPKTAFSAKGYRKATKKLSLTVW
jgi:hypothetical protein